ncbi:bifunctional 5,10-methylenetetrahydrofolate dehydrogenase/5,10-methenyltetrahydrofolate cyclohydrolase [Patescibacteria group bacterium]|nr:bifunctional 5,10-methylenetetrahydrofolate dehydrogenase/5,10-methenyltetrahydrofolate cyclohydrolase [Patescibacteria group bacterium]MBU1922565.1 bifunctional 5,10-methylenetetrahydrofolate dehydrogenase/5,10-methenyltetrahydrofolate cyclohydrolase [Patescibacteria group bacterium]
MQIIVGLALAKKIRQDIKTQIHDLGFIPGLAVILVGADPASHIYVGKKEKACVEAGIHFEKYLYFHTEPPEKILDLIEKLNQRDDIHGILVQLPLPSHFDKDLIIKSIVPKKDVDGFHPENIALLDQGQAAMIPPVYMAILELIKSTGADLSGKKISIIANSEIFSAPLAKILQAKGGEVKIILPPFENIEETIGLSDITITATGKPNFIKGEWLKDGAIVIDCGTTRVGERVVGDVDFESTKQKNGWITPVPGGVGPMTIAMLLRNLVRLAK